MSQSFVDRATLQAFIDRLGGAFGRPGRLYLIGETTQVFQGWRRWTEQVQFTADVADADRTAFDRAVRSTCLHMDIGVLEESPGDVVPLPDGHASRARPAGTAAHLRLYHFDPYSVVFRFLARGDEPDYDLALTFLEHGWITTAELDTLLTGLLPRFSFQSIQQDPAEFRRRYKGLLQMWRARQKSGGEVVES